MGLTAKSDSNLTIAHTAPPPSTTTTTTAHTGSTLGEGPEEGRGISPTPMCEAIDEEKGEEVVESEPSKENRSDQYYGKKRWV